MQPSESAVRVRRRPIVPESSARRRNPSLGINAVTGERVIDPVVVVISSAGGEPEFWVAARTAESRPRDISVPHVLRFCEQRRIPCVAGCRRPRRSRAYRPVLLDRRQNLTVLMPIGVRGMHHDVGVFYKPAAAIGNERTPP